MKRFALLLLAALTLALTAAPALADDSELLTGISGEETAAVPLTGEEINVYNWGVYISDGSEGSLDVNAEFTRRTGIKVNYSTFDSNEALYAKLKTGGATYDVIIPSDYMVGKLIEEDMLAELDYSNIPNYSYIDAEFRNLSYDPDCKYSVPYTWGSVGIIYNTKYVTKPVTSWGSLWDEDYSGKILMFDNSRDAIAIAQSLLGIDVNTTDTAQLDKAIAKLAEQKPLVQQHVMDAIFDAMQHEEAWIAPYYAGDFLTMNAENGDLAFCFPSEGFNRFVDNMCIPANAQNKTAAEKYINFMADPEIMAANLDYIGYSSPSSEARKYISEDYAESEVAYPSSEVLARSYVFENLPSDTVRYMNDEFDAVKASGSGWSLWIFIGIGAVLVALAVFIFIRKKNRNNY